jgi:diaminopropionate ammonia-lyase
MTLSPTFFGEKRPLPAPLPTQGGRVMPSTPLDTPDALLRLWPHYAPTPLLDLPRLAAHCRVAQVVLKDEGKRPLGSFKALGGTYAGLRALARSMRLPDIKALVRGKEAQDALPRLLCASDGNHGLAVAAAAELAGAPARVYLHTAVPPARAERIAARGAEIVRVNGTYDDAVDAAAAAAGRGEGLLISDTSPEENDPVVADVMAGYGLMAEETVSQLRAMGDMRPTHLFVQAGVGGLAAALAEGVWHQMAVARRIVVVEPEKAACVGMALKRGNPVRLPGDLQSSAEMLSCGVASAPALKILLRHRAMPIAVSEAALADAVRVLSACGGPATTASGAAGLAGLLTAAPGSSPRGSELGVDGNSRILLIATEGPVPHNT